MLNYRFLLALGMAVFLVSSQESLLGPQQAQAAVTKGPNNLVGQVAAVNARYIDVHPGYTIVFPNTTYRYYITKNTKIIPSPGGIGLVPGVTVSIQARNGVALTIQIIGYVQ
jgi:hypothetical protein